VVIWGSKLYFSQEREAMLTVCLSLIRQVFKNRSEKLSLCLSLTRLVSVLQQGCNSSPFGFKSFGEPLVFSSWFFFIHFKLLCLNICA
jgi:hypothetical protein